MHVHSCNTVNETFVFCSTSLSTMDYSLKAVDDGVMDSPPNCAVIPVAVNLPSSLRCKGMSEFSMSKCGDMNGEQRNLYLRLSPLPNSRLHKVGLLYHLPCSSSQLLLHNLHF